MDILALLAVAVLQLAALTFEQLRETVDAIKTALVEQYVEPDVDPRTGAGWQVDGVRPDREAPVADALDVALGLAASRAK